jgi:hypothetical protein
MRKDFGSVEFLNKLSGSGRWPSTMEELVDGWVAHYEKGPQRQDDDFFWAFQCASELCSDEAELGFEFVLKTLEKDLSQKALGALAAGPLEDVLAYHGPNVIERVEIESRTNPKFRHLLGGVWQNKMSAEIWRRVLRAAPNRW